VFFLFDLFSAVLPKFPLLHQTPFEVCITVYQTVAPYPSRSDRLGYQPAKQEKSLHNTPLAEIARLRKLF
jgi:hypothetical protein